MTNKSRRRFLKTSLVAAAATGIAGVPRTATGLPEPSSVMPQGMEKDPDLLPIKKGVLVDMLSKQLSYLDRFRMARDVGFELMQANTTPDPHEAAEMKEASEKARIPIESVMNMDHWKYPLSSADPAVVARSMAGMRTSLHNARLWGSHSVLLVPAVVNEQTSYKEAWVRSQKQIRELIPLASELKVFIAIEEVWNKFLLSPLEMARYIDEFKSPWVGAWFDVGNVVFYGYPQDWIRTLGRRIVDVHVKGFKLTGDCFHWVNIGDGQIDWPDVRRAFAEVGYHGAAITELHPGNKAYLQDVSNRVSKYVLGA
ncbi:MAG: TIM barrel protein [Acidobacteriota bacterium]|nr:TIM barrel protein [Acidobacteriota bacterium]